MFKRFQFQFPLVVVCLLLTSSALLAQTAGSDCSSLVMGKSYANSFTGLANLPAFFSALHSTPPPGTGLEPAAGAGSLTFSSGGAFTLKETLAIGMLGVFKDVSITGTYQLSYLSTKHPIVCTGQASGHGFLLGATVPFTYQLIVSSDGGRVEMLQTNEGTIVGFTSRQMPASGTCTNATIGNNFAIDAAHSANTAGWELMSNTPASQSLNGFIPLGISGAVQFSPNTAPTAFPTSPSGAAALTAWETVSMNGHALPLTFTGWYNVNSDCSGSMLLHNTQGAIQDMRYEIFVAADGSVSVVDQDNAITLSNGNHSPVFVIGARLTPLAPAP